MSESGPTEIQIPKGFRPEPFAYHEEIELKIDTLTNMGQGLGRHDGWVIMVRFALPGERIRARIYRNDKNFSEADLVEVLEVSPDRIEAPCHVFGQCGGCQYQHFDYESQLAWKTRQVEELLHHMVGIEAEVLPAIPSPKQYGYRSKLTPHFPKPKQDNLVKIGFLRQGSRSSYVEIEQCPLISDAMNERLTELRERTKQAQVQKPFKKGGTLLIREHADGVTDNPKAIIREQVGDVSFSFPAGEFFQNNPSILESFTAYVGEKASEGGARYLVDAYCGSGLFCLTSAHCFEQAVGIEVSELSIQYAIKNAEANKLENARFVLGDAASIFEQIEFPGSQSSVIIDPPRKGSNEEFLNQLILFSPRKIVYVSCNPATQMRDLRMLIDGGYGIAEVQPFDLFPQTKHLECIVTLSRD
ncbi:MAG: class I SAM-dependent RNA methyltransferase [Opitutales bacterium]|jgi:tRNA/tmRNA/rRNA uracil-C5-methylase (TrmA/RlmC/RlmD family)|nr:class I SAM-dependent RNA methyltransferase [Opitutales bacterium]MDG2254358.1 class I SAM-dependent RNA methyltransferase [Opitutaceae bacterium]MBT5168075.1 class I SAM-dependent RNA methyltransferase [Opitutales bacterium]MBT5813380.1 class I SAM-dependent RNA methyltransferase [Opitutales bacterium]MBT6768528.1 class I SAM-dependent RNA methyltransferase [Opitutales bacterium]